MRSDRGGADLTDLVTTLQIVFSIVSAASAALSASAAFLIYKGNKLNRRAMEQWSTTLVQPRIFLYGSSKGAREVLGTGPGRLLKTQITKGGVFVENVGNGPAMKGVLFVIDHENNQIPVRRTGSNYTFLRMPAGSRYHFPSFDSPELENHIANQRKIRVKVKYFDMNGLEYGLPSDEGEIELFVD